MHITRPTLNYRPMKEAILMSMLMIMETAVKIMKMSQNLMKDLITLRTILMLVVLVKITKILEIMRILTSVLIVIRMVAILTVNFAETAVMNMKDTSAVTMKFVLVVVRSIARMM